MHIPPPSTQRYFVYNGYAVPVPTFEYDESSTLKLRTSTPPKATKAAPANTTQEALQQWEARIRKQEFRVRRGLNFIARLFRQQGLRELHQDIQQLDINSGDYVQMLIAFANSSVKDMVVEVNTEQGRIEDLAASDEACIFYMNHDPKHQQEDTALLSMFLMLLYAEYEKQGKSENCPRPKILMNQDILKTENRMIREIWEKMGAVGVDASLIPNPNTAKTNLIQLKPVLNAFSKDRNHVFIFPEGRRIMFELLEEHRQKDPEEKLKERFQKGISEIVMLMAKKKPRVKLVPLGFSYNADSKDKLGSIYIGEPIYFERHGDTLSCSPGNINRQTSPEYNPLFVEPSMRAFKETGKRVVPAISGVLYENLRICWLKAREQLPNTLPEDLSVVIDPLKSSK